MTDRDVDRRRQWERDVWHKSRFGARSDEPTPGVIRRFLARPFRVMAILGAAAVIVVFGSYAIFGYGDPALSADHEAVAGTLTVDGTICCGVYQEIDGEQYAFIPVLDDPGFFGTQSHDVSLRVARLNDDGSSEEVASIEAPFNSTLPNAAAIVGDAVYIPIGRGNEHERGIWVVDVSEPEFPREISVLDVGSTRFDYVTAGEDDVLTAHSAEEIVLFDASHPTELEVISRLQRPDPGVRRIEIDGDRLYSHASRAGQVRILDIADFSGIVPVGQHLNQSLAGQGMVAVPPRVADAAEQLERTAPSGRYLDFTAAGDYLYVAASDGGLEVADVSNPESSETIGEIELDGRAVRVQLTGERLYVLMADEHSRQQVAYEVHVFDLIDPASPELLERIDGIRAVPGRQNMEIGGGYLWLGLNDTLLVLDIEQ